MSMPIVQAQELSKRYPLGRQSVDALRGVSFALSPGEFIVLLGPSGAGKTTTLNLLGCLDLPTGGELSLAGRTIFSPTHRLGEAQLDNVRRRHVGLVFNDFHLLPTLTAAENVELPLLWDGKRDRQRAVDLLQAVGLGHRLTHHPGELSGGEMQRVAIARSLVNSPDLLLADEPTGNLDTRTRDDVFDLLGRLNKERGLTVLLATHDHELAAQASRVIELRDGLIVGGDGDGEH